MTGRRIAGLLAALAAAGALLGGLAGVWREHAIAHALDGFSDDEAGANR